MNPAPKPRPSAADTGRTVEDLWPLIGGADDHPPAVSVTAPTVPVASAYPVAEIAAASVAAATAAALGLHHGPVVLDGDHVLADWRAHVRLDGRDVPGWAPLSGRYRSEDGRYVQLHCNFPHHAAGVAARLGVAADRHAVAAAIATWDAFELEDVLRHDGLVAAAYRDLDEWDDHPHAVACRSLPLIDVEKIGEAPPASGSTAGAGGSVDGLRVLDCSRVLAGPVCGRTLAAHGADVLRVGAAHLPAVEMAVLATGFGKRNTDLDLRSVEDRQVFEALLADADVLVDAYRPGALAGLGFPAARVAEIRPGIALVEISGFDWVGPWGGRRGFDSIVQSTTGIAISQGRLSGTEEPVHLPVQALDFATGYLAAFAAARLVGRQRTIGGSWRARLSLLRTRNWLVGGGPAPDFEPGPPPEADRFVETVDTEMGSLEAVRPVAGRWATPPSPLGSAPPAWL